MELKKYFGYEGVLNRKTAPEVWELTKKAFEAGLSVRKIIEMSNVEVICTTDDPIDDLQWHEKIKGEGLKYKVLPAWRPDKLVNIEKPDFAEYMAKLQEFSAVEIKDKNSLKEAICNRLDYFQERGCSVSDHGLDYVPYGRCTDDEFDSILQRGLEGKDLSEAEIEAYKTEVLLIMSAEYSKRSWVMQLHYGCHRNNNSDMYAKMGPDVGFDSISNYAPSEKLARFMDAANEGIGLPKTIIYSLNPSDNAVIGTLIGCFQDGKAAGKIQHGSAWWFNDNKVGMEQQMISLANLGILGKFVGMLTDSRSFLSYTRHEYFRRIMCNILGEWIEDGEYPEDYDSLERIVKGISYENAAKYFDFK